MPAVRRRLPIRGVFASLALLWPATLLAGARIAALPDRAAAADLFSAAVYYSGSLLCHQRPERSFHFWAVQLPVCARCAGIYAGAAIGVIAALVRPPAFATAAGGSAAARARGAARMILFGASLPTVLTLGYEWTTGVMPANWIRALSGLVLGAAAAIVVMRAGAPAVGEVN